MAMAVKLFEMKRLSSGMAAKLVGMDRVPFLLSLSDYGVPMIDLESVWKFLFGRIGGVKPDLDCQTGGYIVAQRTDLHQRSD